MQAWPEDALQIQPNGRSPPESQMPSQWEEQSTSATADDGSDQPHPELQVRVCIIKQLLLTQCHASTVPALHASSSLLRATSSLHKLQQAHAHLAWGNPFRRVQEMGSYFTCDSHGCAGMAQRMI